MTELRKRHPGSPRYSKLTPDDVRLIRVSKQSNAVLARITGVTREAIRQLRAGTTWSGVK